MKFKDRRIEVINEEQKIISVTIEGYTQMVIVSDKLIENLMGLEVITGLNETFEKYIIDSVKKYKDEKRKRVRKGSDFE